MKESSRKCYNCTYVEKFYTKGVKSMVKTDYGRCVKKNKLVNLREGCEECEFKRRSNRISMLVKGDLSRLLMDISEIRKIIEEEVNIGNEEM